MNNFFTFEDLIIRLPSINIETINLDFKTITNTKIIDKDEQILEHMIDDMGYKNFKAASVLVNPYSFVNLNNVDLNFLKRNLNVNHINTCKENKAILTRAYYKLWEIIDHFKLINNSYTNGMVSSNVAEGPGGFIQSVIYYRINKSVIGKEDYLKDKLYGISIKTTGNLNFEDNITKKFREIYEKRYNMLNISYGGDDGNLTKINVIKKYIENFKDKKADIFTGDGGIEVNSSLGKEILNGQLIICEAIIGLSVLKKGGHFVLKTYTFTLPCNIQLLQILSSYFEEFYITKPVTSRVFNTEKYIVGKNFKGIDKTELDKLLLIIENLKKMENNDKYVYNIISNKINIDLKNKVEQFNKSHFQLRLKLLNQVKYILDNKNKNKPNAKNIINKYKTFVEKTSLNWCKQHNLNFLIND